MKFARVALLSSIAVIFILVVFSFPSYGNSNIVQTVCVRNTVVSNDQAVTAQFATNPPIGDSVYAVITVQGTTTQTISYTNTTDNIDAGGLIPQYAHVFRTTDFGNTLIVSFQSYTVDTLNAGLHFTVSSSYHATTNMNNRVIICIYDLTGLSGAGIVTSQKSGGALPQTTGTTGTVTLSGAAGNAGGGTYTFSGSFDSSAFPDFIGVGSGSGTWNGLTGVTFVIEGDISIGNSTTITSTSTIIGFLVPNFVNGVNSFSWLYFLLVVFIPMGEIIGLVTAEGRGMLDRHAIIFVFLGLLLLDSIFGVMLNVVTVAMPFIFGLLFGIYLWRGRG